MDDVTYNFKLRSRFVRKGSEVQPDKKMRNRKAKKVLKYFFKPFSDM